MRRVAAVIVAVFLLAACSGNDDTSSVSQQSQSPTVPPVLATAKPTVAVPKGAAPKTLVRTDLTVGTGDFAVPGKTVTVQYVGVHFDNGKQFDASWDSGHPFSFQLGGEQVIAGWDEGVVGMRVGGRRQLVIPPDLGYGPKGDGTGVIGPNETLVFVVDLISVAGVPAGVGNPPPPSSG